MQIHNKGLEKEFGYVTKPAEVNHIQSLFEKSAPIMHDIAHNLIVGKHTEVDRLTKEALDEGFHANTILDDGLIAGMAIVGIKFRDNIISCQRCW